MLPVFLQYIATLSQGHSLQSYKNIFMESLRVKWPVSKKNDRNENV